MNKTIGLNRILKLAAFVEKTPAKRFNFATIVGDNWGGLPDLSCGTTACALGWATTMPLFRKLGLHLLPYNKYVVLDNDTFIDWEDIGSRIFGIKSTVMYALFQPNDDIDEESYINYDTGYVYPSLSNDTTSKQWAKHARRIVRILQNERS